MFYFFGVWFLLSGVIAKNAFDNRERANRIVYNPPNHSCGIKSDSSSACKCRFSFESVFPRPLQVHTLFSSVYIYVIQYPLLFLVIF